MGMLGSFLRIVGVRLWLYSRHPKKVLSIPENKSGSIKLSIQPGVALKSVAWRPALYTTSISFGLCTASVLAVTSILVLQKQLVWKETHIRGHKSNMDFWIGCSRMRLHSIKIFDNFNTAIVSSIYHAMFTSSRIILIKMRAIIFYFQCRQIHL